MEGVPAEENCALVVELVQVLEMARQLEAHMAAVQQQQQQEGGGGAGGGADQRCRALVSTMRASMDRAVHMAVVSSCCAEGRPGAAGQLPESPLSGGDGSPRSGGSDQAGEFRGRGNAAGQCKKRKTLPKWSTQVRVSTVQNVSPLDDGLSWRKYGQKDILGAKYPRSYFRCTHRHTQSCQASKQVQRTDGDPLLFDVVYHGAHTCVQGAAAHPSNNQPAVQEQMTSPGLEAGPAMLPFSLRPASNKPTGADDVAGTATSSRFVTTTGCASVTASPFVSPATPEYQLVSSGGGDSYAVGGGGGATIAAGVRNVPDVELASTTNSPMALAEMDFMFPLDAADFLELGNPASYF